MSDGEEVRACLRRRGQYGALQEWHIATQWNIRREVEERQNTKRLIAYRQKRADLEDIPAMPTAKGGER